MFYRNLVVTTAIVVAFSASAISRAEKPLENAHAHNDYLHEHPLFDALDLGFNSVEADIFLVDGELLVGHSRGQLKPERTLESLYLGPLARRVKQNGGHVYPDGGRFFLLIDVKNEPLETYRHLAKELATHADMLTTVEDGKVRPGAITAVVTGAQSRAELLKANPRYAGLDGHLTDLDTHEPAHAMPMISDNWTSHFSWQGDGPIPAAEQAKLKEITTKTHAAGRVVRFWATPENENFWRELRSDGVDLLNTDQLKRLAVFLRSSEAPKQP
jgi:hypothetical protein